MSSSRSTRRRSARLSRSRAAIAASREWPKRSAARPTITWSIPIAVSTSLIARRAACRLPTCCSRTDLLRHALVLTAGLGTRLRPLTDVRAKPAIPVAGEPMIRRIITWLASRGVTDLVLNLHHLPHTLTAVVGDASDLGVRVRYSWEQPTILDDCGRLPGSARAPEDGGLFPRG